LPHGATYSGVFRGGKLFSVADTQELCAGDLVAVIASPAMLEDLSKVFDTRPRTSPLEDRQFFGEFVLNGDATVGDVELFYGIDISHYEPEKASLPVSARNTVIRLWVINCAWVRSSWWPGRLMAMK